MFSWEMVRFLCVKSTHEACSCYMLYMVLCVEPMGWLGIQRVQKNRNSGTCSTLTQFIKENIYYHALFTWEMGSIYLTGYWLVLLSDWIWLTGGTWLCVIGGPSELSINCSVVMVVVVNLVFMLTYMASSQTAKITKINLNWGPYKFRIRDNSNVIYESLSLST